MNTNVALNSKLDQIIFIYKKTKFSTPVFICKQKKKGAQSQKVSDRTSIRLENKNEIISFTLTLCDLFPIDFFLYYRQTVK